MSSCCTPTSGQGFPSPPVLRCPSPPLWVLSIGTCAALTKVP